MPFVFSSRLGLFAYQRRPRAVADLRRRSGGVHVAEEVLDPPKGDAAACVAHLWMQPFFLKFTGGIFEDYRLSSTWVADLDLDGHVLIATGHQDVDGGELVAVLVSLNGGSHGVLLKTSTKEAVRHLLAPPTLGPAFTVGSP